MLPLINRTEQSYGRSMMKPSDIVKHAKKIGSPVAAITDVHSLSALPEFLLECQKEGIHGIAGLTVQIIDGKKPIGDMVLLAKGGRGFAALRDIIGKVGHVGLDDKFNPERGLELSELLDEKMKALLGHCVSLDGFPGSIGEALIKRETPDYDVGGITALLNNEESLLARLKAQFSDGDYLGVKTQITQSPLASVLAMPDNSLNKNNSMEERRNVLDVTMAFSKDETQSRQTMQWFKSYASSYLGELSDQSKVNTMIMQKFIKATLSGADGFSYKPSSPPFQNAEYLVSKCATPNIYKEQPSSALIKGGKLNQTLVELVEPKWNEYVKTLPKNDMELYRKRLEHELDVIIYCGFEHYFVNIFEVQSMLDAQRNWSMLRGSAVASLVMHVMELSPIDPIKAGLLFKRFMSKYRIEDPDADMEFINPSGAIKAMEENFDSGQIALLSSDKGISKALTLIELAKESILNFYNLDDQSKANIEKDFKTLTAPLYDEKNKKKKWAGSLANWVPEIWDKTPENKKTSSMKALVGIAKNFNGLARGSSVSPGSVIFVPEGAGRYFNLLPATKGAVVPGAVPRIPQTKHNLLATGYIKYDFLSNRSFTRSMNAWETIGLPIKARLDTDDSSIGFVFKKHAFMGVNQVSGYSGGALAEKFEPKNFSELTALNALIREAGNPSTQSLIEQYLYFKENPSEVKLDDVVLPILGETHGCLIYEEQLMRMLTIVGGLEWEEADSFRSGLKKGKGAVIDQFEPIFIQRAMKLHNVSEEKASEWYQPLRDKRGRFVFNKAHAVAYAYVAVRQCWLKANAPAQFAAENFVDDNVSFRGKKVKLTDILEDWKKLYPTGSPENAQDFFNAVGKILIREEKIPESLYRRNPAPLKRDIAEAINAGAFNNLMPDGWTQAHLVAYSEQVFLRLEERGYSPIKNEEIKSSAKKPSTDKTPNNGAQSNPSKKSSNSTSVTKENAAGTIGPAPRDPESDEPEVLPANRRPGYINWKDGVMIGHLLNFFSEEGVIDNFHMTTGKASYADHYRFSMKGKDGATHDFHLGGISTDPVRASKKKAAYSMTSGFFQGGERDKKRTSTVDIAAEILSLTNDPRFARSELDKIEVTLKNGQAVIGKDSYKPLFSQLLKFAKNAKAPLHDVESGGMVDPGKSMAMPNSPIMTELFSGQQERGHKMLLELFQESRKISVQGLAEQLNNGHLSIGEVRADKFDEKNGYRKFLCAFANYRKVMSDIPLYEVPLIKNNVLSEGGHQRFMFDYKKNKTSKIDQGTTTSRIKGHVHGHITPNSQTLWFTEAALDTWSFNELQREVKTLNFKKNMNLPFAEENSVSIKNAGGATYSMEAMLSVEITYDQDAGTVDFCQVLKKKEASPFTDNEKRSLKGWFDGKTLHWLSDGSDEDNVANLRLKTLMLEIGMSDVEINNCVVVHRKNPKQNFNQAVNDIYNNSIKTENDCFFSQSNLETWFRSSDVAVLAKPGGGFVAGNATEKVEKGPMFSLMSPTQKEQVKVYLKQQFEYLSGAKSLGLAVDNDGAGRKDALTVYNFCNLIDVPVLTLMPKLRNDIYLDIDGKTTKFPLKDHNDYLTLLRAYESNGQMEEFESLVIDYSSNLTYPKIRHEKVINEAPLPSVPKRK